MLDILLILFGVGFIALPLAVATVVKSVDLKKWLRRTAGCAAFVVGVIFVVMAADDWIDERARAKLEAKLQTTLVVGDNAQKIEQVLAYHGLFFIYESVPFSRYSSIIRWGRLSNCGLQIYVEVDEQKKMKRVTVQKFYTDL